MNNSFSIQHSSAFNKVMAYTSRDTGDLLSSRQKKILALIIIFFILVLPGLGFLGSALYKRFNSETEFETQVFNDIGLSWSEINIIKKE